MAKVALITGASSGIGKATAEVFAKNGIDLVICGRRIEKLDKLAALLSVSVKVHVLKFDVRNKQEVYDAIGSLPADFQKIDILVNNAGNAHGLEPFHEGDDMDWDLMMDANVKGLLYVSKAVITGMVERMSGHIVNISSIAGKEVYVNGNVYCASKHAVEALTKGIRLDLNKFGIKVTSVSPGMVETEFSLIRFKGDTARATKTYEGVEPLKPEDIADNIWYVVSRPPHVTISDITILASAQASATLINRKGV